LSFREAGAARADRWHRAAACTQRAQDLDDVGLYSDVERGGRLVQHDHVELEDKGASNCHALALTT